MVLKIRLRQQGRNNRATYRLVVADVRSPRDGKYIEKLGSYDPHQSSEKEGQIAEERICYWIDQGAQLTEKVYAFLARRAPLAIEKVRRRKEEQLRKARNSRRSS